MTDNNKSLIKYEDVTIVANRGDFKTYWTVEIYTKLTKRQAGKLADMIYNLGENLVDQ